MPQNHHAEGLAAASRNAEFAFQAAFSRENAHHPPRERYLWAAAAILHCDILRYVVTFEESTREGLVRLLWIGDIVSMLYEAKKWFYRNGSPELVAIADERGYGKDRCRKKVKEIQRAFPLDGVREFANYRNKVGYHYDLDFVEHLRDFGKISADSFNSVLTNYAKFSREWVVLCREVLNSAPS